MLDQLPSLIELQRHDSDVQTLEQKAKAFDPLIKRKNVELESLKSNLKTSKESLQSNQLKKRDLEAQVEEKQKLIQKHNAELNSLKSNDAYKAMLGEIQAAKQAVLEIEDQILVVMEAIDAGDKMYKEAEKKMKSEEAVIKGDIQKLEADKSAALSVATKRKEERDAYAKTISAPALNQYETVRAKRGGVAIVPMLNNSCGGCHLSLTQNKINEVRKAKNVVVCESCSRIIYNPPAEASQAAGEPASKPAESAPTTTP